MVASTAAMKASVLPRSSTVTELFSVAVAAVCWSLSTEFEVEASVEEVM